ncbi:hypothetical protein AVEN_72297-1 [Araneus ventricosus]|uniref:Uncharacterized protein n=1 Tax=Araneus ventricosus TaxID=182803 RepID=A0A4Y2TDF6_ARAVE|nr:hypothetical protein AVEN_72297-1 [Araneus ventricosus]
MGLPVAPLDMTFNGATWHAPPIWTSKMGYRCTPHLIADIRSVYRHTPHLDMTFNGSHRYAPIGWQRDLNGSHWQAAPPDMTLKMKPPVVRTA